MAEIVATQISGIIRDPASWTVTPVEAEELVLVPVAGRAGAMIKMRKSEALAKGLWQEPDGKAQGQRINKARRPMKNKAQAGTQGASDGGGQV